MLNTKDDDDEGIDVRVDIQNDDSRVVILHSSSNRSDSEGWRSRSPTVRRRGSADPGLVPPGGVGGRAPPSPPLPVEDVLAKDNHYWSTSIDGITVHVNGTFL